MAINKLHDEFHTLDMSSGWEVPTGYPAGIQQKILSGGLDETNRRGTRTRLLRFAPGVFTTAPFEHEYWEEVYLVSGDLTVGNDAQGLGAFPSECGAAPCCVPLRGELQRGEERLRDHVQGRAGRRDGGVVRGRVRLGIGEWPGEDAALGQ